MSSQRFKLKGNDEPSLFLKVQFRILILKLYWFDLTEQDFSSTISKNLKHSRNTTVFCDFSTEKLTIFVLLSKRKKFENFVPIRLSRQSPKLKIQQLPNGWLWFNYNSNCYYNSNLMQCNNILKWPQTASERPQFCIRRRRVLLAWENFLILRPSIVF